LSRGLQRAWPDAKFYGVWVGHKPTDREAGRAELIEAPEAYSAKAELPPPFPSCPYYDAKVWRFMRKTAMKGALFWNVAA